MWNFVLGVVVGLAGQQLLTTGRISIPGLGAVGLVGGGDMPDSTPILKRGSN